MLFEPAPGLLKRGGGVKAGLNVNAMREGAQAAFANILAKRAHILEHFGRIAYQANAGGDHQKGHDEQEPPGIVDFGHTEFAEDGVPVHAELVGVGQLWLVLLQHSADNAGHADEHEQAHRETHRAKQFYELGAPGSGI